MGTNVASWNAQQLVAVLCLAILVQPLGAQQRTTTPPRTITSRGPVPILGLEYWNSEEDCEHVEDFVYYHPRIARHRALAIGEFVAGIPRKACVEMPLPEIG